MHSPGSGLSLDRSHSPRESATVLARVLLTFLVAGLAVLTLFCQWEPRFRASYPCLLSSDYLDRPITRFGGCAGTQEQLTFFAMTGDSDLAGVYLTLGVILAFLGVLAAFFFVGPVVGIVLLIAAVILAIVLLVRWIKANELT